MRPFLAALTGVVTGVFGLTGLLVPWYITQLHYPFGMHFTGFALWLIFSLSILTLIGCSSMHSTSWQVKHYMGLAPQHGSLWSAISAIASFFAGIFYWAVFLVDPTPGVQDSVSTDWLFSAWLLALGLGIVVLISISRDAVREEREAREAERQHAFA